MGMAPLLLFGCPLMRILLPLIAVVGCGCCPFMLLPLALASGCCPLLWIPLLAVGWYATNQCKTPCYKKQAGSCKGQQGGKGQAVASSGRPITVTAVPGVGQRCHLDRGYTFTDLGDFKQPNMLYLMTSNSDKSTAASQVMWTLQCSVPVTVHINFRSQQHAAAAKAWLQAQGWGLNLLTCSTVSTGVPHGPYSGPVYSKQCTAGQIDLMGSNCKEGTYLVFVELPTQAPAAAQQPASDNKPELHQKQQPWRWQQQQRRSRLNLHQARSLRRSSQSSNWPLCNNWWRWGMVMKHSTRWFWMPAPQMCLRRWQSCSCCRGGCRNCSSCRRWD